MPSVAIEVDRCLPFFVRLCINRVVQTGETLDKSAVAVATRLHGKFPNNISDLLRGHFEASLAELAHLVSALSTRLPPEVLRDFVERASEDQVAGTLGRSLRSAMMTNSLT